MTTPRLQVYVSCHFYSQIVAAFDPSIVTSPGAYLNDCVIHDDQLPDSAKDEVSLYTSGQLRLTPYGTE